jgi:hypothetical protein
MGIGDNFWDRARIAQEIIKFDKLDCIKLEGFCKGKTEGRNSLQNGRKSLLAILQQRINIQTI